jgi:hypothetical protein
MMADNITYGQLCELLSDLDFVDEPAKQPWKVYRHGDTDTLIVLARRKPTAPAPEADLVSVRRHLVAKGLIEESEFERFLSLGRLAESD